MKNLTVFYAFHLLLLHAKGQKPNNFALVFNALHTYQPTPVDALVKKTGMDQAMVSQNLAHLRTLGWTAYKQDGRHHLYSITPRYHRDMEQAKKILSAQEINQLLSA